MIEKLAPFLKKALPAGVALKGISSSNSRMKKFITSAAAAGYSTDVILDFIRGLTKKSGRQQMLENAAFRKSQGTARPDELVEAQQFEEQEARKQALKGAAAVGAGLASSALPVGAAGRAAASLIPGLLGGGEEQTQERETQPTFFQRAMQGVDFLNLSDKNKQRVGPLMKRLDRMEEQGMSWKDRSVQTIVNALRRITKTEDKGLIETESARFQQTQPQQSNADQELMAMLQDITNKFLS